MKKIHVVIATLVAVAIVLFAPAAKGQAPATAVVPSKTPVFIPVGKEARLNWAITNQQWSVRTGGQMLTVSLLVRIEYGSAWKEIEVIDPTFNSFADFEKTVSITGLKLITQLKTKVAPDTALTLRTTLICSDWNSDDTFYYPYESVKYLGPIKDISDITILDAEIKSQDVVIRVAGLEEFGVVVHREDGTTYTNVWPNLNGGNKPQGTLPAEYTRPGIIVLNEWYSLGTEDVHFWVKALGERTDYTRFGFSLFSPSITALSDRKIRVRKTPGSKTTIEYTTDFKSWSVMKVIGPESDLESEEVFTYPPSHQMFFRGKSEF